MSESISAVDPATKTDPAIQIGADGVDVHKIEMEILESIEKKKSSYEYNDALIAKAERHNLMNVKNGANSMDAYFDCLHLLCPIDINDFEIVEHRSRLAPLLKTLKKTIWKLLKFYTFRLWSQQNQSNELLLAAIESVYHRQNEELQSLKNRVAELEKRLGDKAKEEH